MNSELNKTDNPMDDNKRIGAIIMLEMPGVNNINTDADDLDDNNSNPPTPPTPDTNDATPPTPTNDVLINIDGNDYKVDTNGNALDNEGKIFKTKDDLLALQDSTQTVVSIDNVDYNIDAKGNAINDKGEIVYTKEQIDNFGSDESYNTIVQKTIGMEITDVNGQPIEYEDSPIGLSKYVEDVASIKANEIAGTILKERYSKFPILKDIEQHLILNNGNIDGFNNEIDYSNIQLDAENEEQLMDVIIREKMDKGETEATAKYLANIFKKEAVLMEKATEALAYLDNTTTQAREHRANLVAIQEQEELDAENAIWNEVYTKVAEDKKIVIGDETIIIPDYMKRTVDGKIINASRQDFLKYMYVKQPYNIDGERVLMSDNEVAIYNEDKNKTTDNEIFEAYRRFVGYDDAQILRDKKNNLSTKNVRNAASNMNHKHSPAKVVYKTKVATENIVTG